MSISRQELLEIHHSRILLTTDQFSVSVSTDDQNYVTVVAIDSTQGHTYRGKSISALAKGQSVNDSGDRDPSVATPNPLQIEEDIFSIDTIKSVLNLTNNSSTFSVQIPNLVTTGAPPSIIPGKGKWL
jgi:hypothetical protein